METRPTTRTSPAPALQLMDRVVSQDAGVKINMERVYGSGHSLGCRTVQTFDPQ